MVFGLLIDVVLLDGVGPGAHPPLLGPDLEPCQGKLKKHPYEEKEALQHALGDGRALGG